MGMGKAADGGRGVEERAGGVEELRYGMGTGMGKAADGGPDMRSNMRSCPWPRHVATATRLAATAAHFLPAVGEQRPQPFEKGSLQRGELGKPTLAQVDFDLRSCLENACVGPPWR